MPPRNVKGTSTPSSLWPHPEGRGSWGTRPEPQVALAVCVRLFILACAHSLSCGSCLCPKQALSEPPVTGDAARLPRCWESPWSWGPTEGCSLRLSEALLARVFSSFRLGEETPSLGRAPNQPRVRRPQGGAGLVAPTPGLLPSSPHSWHSPAGGPGLCWVCGQGPPQSAAPRCLHRRLGPRARAGNIPQGPRRPKVS